MIRTFAHDLLELFGYIAITSPLNASNCGSGQQFADRLYVKNALVEIRHGRRTQAFADRGGPTKIPRIPAGGGSAGAGRQLDRTGTVVANDRALTRCRLARQERRLAHLATDGINIDGYDYRAPESACTHDQPCCTTRKATPGKSIRFDLQGRFHRHRRMPGTDWHRPPNSPPSTKPRNGGDQRNAPSPAPKPRRSIPRSPEILRDRASAVSLAAFAQVRRNARHARPAGRPPPLRSKAIEPPPRVSEEAMQRLREQCAH